MNDDGGGPAGAEGGDAADADGTVATDGATDAPPPPPGVPDATEIGSDVLRGNADGLEARVDELYRTAMDARDAFEPPADDEQRALAYCRHGLWPVLAVYVDRRGAGAALEQPQHDRLETALNAWLELYARSYGVEIAVDFSVREAAELFVSTHNVRDVAQLLTEVPERG